MNIGKFIRAIVPCRIYWPHWLFRKASMRWYKKHHGYTFDLDNPVTFTEKVPWYMCEYDGTEISNITDKVKFKFYIDEKLGGEKLSLCMDIGINRKISKRLGKVAKVFCT